MNRAAAKRLALESVRRMGARELAEVMIYAPYIPFHVTPDLTERQMRSRYWIFSPVRLFWTLRYAWKNYQAKRKIRAACYAADAGPLMRQYMRRYAEQRVNENYFSRVVIDSRD